MNVQFQHRMAAIALVLHLVAPCQAGPGPTASASSAGSILDYKFTNELGRAVALNDFRGQAVAVTFIYTRCPVAEFCPRLSKNFQAVQQRLAAMPNAPTNWHLISVSFDPEDSPETLQRYGQTYQYDPARWTFLTGPRDKIAELARAAGVQYAPESGVVTHNFRTLIIDTNGGLQMVFPTSGDLSSQIAGELLKALSAKDPLAGNKDGPKAASTR